MSVRLLYDSMTHLRFYSFKIKCIKIVSVLLIVLFYNNYLYSQNIFQQTDSIISLNTKRTINSPIYPSFSIDSKKNPLLLDLSINSFNQNSIVTDTLFQFDDIFNYGFGADYSYDLNENEIIDFSLMIYPSISTFSLNSIKCMVIFYF